MDHLHGPDDLPDESWTNDAAPPPQPDGPPSPSPGSHADGPRADDALLPGHASCVVVPVANPATAGDLLRLAIALCEVGGTVVAVSVALDDAGTEAAREISEQLRSAYEQIEHETHGRELELLARPAPSVARGVLEVTREAGADMLVLGIAVSEDGGSLLGPVAESIIDLAPCDVLLVRPGRDGGRVTDADRVVVTVDGHEAARTAARTAVLLGDGLDRPVEVVHVMERGRPPFDGHAVIAQSLHGVEGARGVERQLLRGSNVASSVLRTVDGDDLLVVGLHRETALRRWLFGSIVTDLMRRSRGPVLVVARRTGAERERSAVARIAEWLRPALTDVEQETLLWQARRQGGTTIDYMTLLTLSAVLATLGLVQDSVAVIIGAMLVAPLLGPLSAMAIGLVTARTPLVERSFATLAIGTAAAIAVSTVIGWILPIAGPTSQMLLRGAPSLLDVGVAMASGLVGAYATARKDIPAALAGVAIAAALVPPICTIGLGLALGDPSLAGGALLLFLVNVSAVIVTGAAGFWWFGLHPVEQDSATRRRIVSAAVAAGLALLVVTTVTGLLEASRRAGIATEDVRGAFDGDDLDLVSVDVDEAVDPVAITVTVRSTEPLAGDELRQIEQELADDLGRDVALRVVVLTVVTPDTPDDE